MQFFSSAKRLQEIFFQNHPPPPLPQELNGRPLSMWISFLLLHLSVSRHEWKYMKWLLFWTSDKDMKVEMILAMAWNDRHSGLLSSSLMDRALRPVFAKVRPVRFPFGIFPVSGSFPPSYFVTGQVNMRSPFQTNQGFIIIIIIIVVVVIFVKVFVDETFVFSWFFEKARL